MKLFRLLAAAVIMMSMASCGVVVRSSYTPSVTQLNIGMDDLEYLGETEISVTYDTYCLIFSKMRSINGADFDPGNIQIAPLKSYNKKFAFTGLGRRLERASYKVFEQFPTADYFVVTRQLSRQKLLFLGREVESTAVVKAYKFK